MSVEPLYRAGTTERAFTSLLGHAMRLAKRARLLQRKSSCLLRQAHITYPMYSPVHRDDDVGGSSREVYHTNQDVEDLRVASPAHHDGARGYRRKDSKNVESKPVCVDTNRAHKTKRSAVGRGVRASRVNRALLVDCWQGVVTPQ